MSARRGTVPPWPLLALALVPVLAARLGPAAAADTDEELPHAAAHKQVVYRYIPIDKSFLNLDRAYDDYYKTGSTGAKPRKDYGPPRRYSGRLDSYDQLYNDNYRRSDYDYYSQPIDDGEVDTYSSYSPPSDGYHDLSNSRRHAHDYGDYYDYDYSQDYKSTRRPKRRRTKKKKKKNKPMSTRVLDFAEAMIRRIWSPTDTERDSHGHGHGHKGRHKKKKKKPRRRFKWPRFISFDAVMQYLSYLLGIGAVVGYILLVTLNAVASDGNLNLFNRSLDSGRAELLDAEALRLLRLLDAAIERYRDGRCLLCRPDGADETASA